MQNETSLLARSLRSLPYHPIFRGLCRSIKRFAQRSNCSEPWARVVMNHETREIISSLSPENLDTLEISGSSWSKEVPFRSYKSVHYPDFEICDSPLAE